MTRHVISSLGENPDLPLASPRSPATPVSASGGHHPPNASVTPRRQSAFDLASPRWRAVVQGSPRGGLGKEAGFRDGDARRSSAHSVPQQTAAAAQCDAGNGGGDGPVDEGDEGKVEDDDAAGPSEVELSRLEPPRAAPQRHQDACGAPRPPRPGEDELPRRVVVDDDDEYDAYDARGELAAAAAHPIPDVVESEYRLCGLVAPTTSGGGGAQASCAGVFSLGGRWSNAGSAEPPPPPTPPSAARAAFIMACGAVDGLEFCSSPKATRSP